MLDARSQLCSSAVVALNKPDTICVHTSYAQSHALVRLISGPPSIFSCVTIRQDDERKFCSAAGTLVPAIASSYISQLALYCILLPSEHLSLYFQR
jgi:precorrin-4 methylase